MTDNLSKKDSRELFNSLTLTVEGLRVELKLYEAAADLYKKERDMALADKAWLNQVVDKCEDICRSTIVVCEDGYPISAKNVAAAILRVIKP